MSVWRRPNPAEVRKTRKMLSNGGLYLILVQGLAGFAVHSIDTALRVAPFMVLLGVCTPCFQALTGWVSWEDRDALIKAAMIEAAQHELSSVLRDIEYAGAGQGRFERYGRLVAEVETLKEAPPRRDPSTAIAFFAGRFALVSAVAGPLLVLLAPLLAPLAGVPGVWRVLRWVFHSL